MSVTGRLWALALAFLLDLAIGDPAWLPHPVRLIGRYIAWAEAFGPDAAACAWAR